MMNFARIWYQIRNWRAHLWALLLGSTNTSVDGRVTYKGELHATKIGKDGKRTELGLLSKRVVTTAGVNYLAADMNEGASDINAFDWHASGTGIVAEAVGDTALGTDSAVARVSGTASNPTANQYRSVATMSYTSTLAITEHGLFSASTAGTLWDRSVFAAINVVSGDSIQFTYTLTVTAGG